MSRGFFEEFCQKRQELLNLGCSSKEQAEELMRVAGHPRLAPRALAWLRGEFAELLRTSYGDRDVAKEAISLALYPFFLRPDGRHNRPFRWPWEKISQALRGLGFTPPRVFEGDPEWAGPALLACARRALELGLEEAKEPEPEEAKEPEPEASSAS